MKRLLYISVLVGLLILSMCAACFADFQYTESSKLTGGTLAGAMKFIGVFSKSAKQAQATTSKTSLKGNKMRRENDQGMVEIYDLDSHSIITLDDKHKTYSVLTFDEMKAEMEKEQQKAAQQRAKSKNGEAQVKMTPKIKISAGKETKKLLNYTAKELKIRTDMVMESTDPKQQGQTADMWFTSDAWIAPVPGYKELKSFNLRLAKELAWLPGTAFGGGVQISPAMVEYRKEAANFDGMPLEQLVSFGGMGGQSGAQASSTPSSNPISRGLGVFHKKKKPADDSGQNATPSSGPAASPTPNDGKSMLDMTIDVTAVSTDAVSDSAFEIPQGYKRVQGNPANIH